MKPRGEEIAQKWLDRARDDVLWAKDSLTDGHFSGVCFLAQQIVEKSLKAYLYFKGETLIRTHDLFRLLRKCQKYQLEFEKFLPNIKILNNYYTDTRYPDIWDMERFENEKLAKEALELAKGLVGFVEQKMNIIT